MSGVYNESEPNGGNSLTDALAMNGQYTTGDVAWILFASALVWIMIPGIGYPQTLARALIIASFMAGWVDERVHWH